MDKTMHGWNDSTTTTHYMDSTMDHDLYSEIDSDSMEIIMTEDHRHEEDTDDSIVVKVYVSV